MKKLFTLVVVIATIVSTLGLTAIVPAASAASTGDKIKVAGNSAVYYVSGSSKHLFSTEKTFWTWYSGTWGNNPVMTVSQSEFDALTTGANVIARAGSLVKFDNSPKVYVVGMNGMLYNLTEETAKAWYGADYSTKVNTIQSSFEANYTKSSEMPTKAVDGMLVKYAGSEDVYLIQDGKKRMVSDEGFTANKFKDSMVITIPASMTYSNGSSITGVEAGVWNVAGKAGSSSNDDDMTVDGTDGTISDVNELSQYNNEEVGEGEEDVVIAGFEVEASNEGDIKLRSVKVSFDSTGNTGSDKLDHYVDTVSVWHGSTKIGSASADDFNEEDTNGVYSRTITLSDNVIVDADQTEKFVIAVDAVSNLDGSDISGDSWTVDVENIRFEDGSGVVTTETGYELDGMDVPMTFVDFAAAADTEFKITTASNTPDAGIEIIDESDSTDDVELLKGKIEIEGESDVLLDEFPVTFTVGGTATGLASTTGSVTLVIDGEEYTETVGSSFNALVSSVTFDNLDLEINAGDTLEFEVLIDVEGTDGVTTEGDTVTASVTASNRAMIDVENEEGDQLTSSEKTGTATGETREFRTTGVQLTLVSADASVTAGTSANDDLATFKLKFKVKAIGDTVYVSSLTDALASTLNTDGYTTVRVERAGVATTGGVSVTLTNVTDNDLTSVGLYEIEENTEETLEVIITVQASSQYASGAQYRGILNGIRWSTDATDATPSNSYTSELDSFKTSYIGVN